MRRHLLGIVTLAACYSPRLPAGALCTTDLQCPIEQRCAGGRCGFGDVDAGAVDTGDAGPIVDVAGDSPVACAMATGHDEDGDTVDDGCDSCPTVFESTPQDDDRDGVSSRCDPSPGVAGDHILRFEGFARLPQGWSTDGIVQSDALALNGLNQTNAELTAPDILRDTAAVPVVRASMSFVIDDADTNEDVSIEISLVNDTDDVTCKILTSDAGRTLVLERAGQPLATVDLSVADGAYTMSMIRNTADYSCNVATAATSKSTSSRTLDSATRSTVEIGVFGAAIRVESLLVVGR